ncbi:hypothetical protein, partial [Rhizobium anhuiense]
MARCGGRKQAASPFGCSVPNVVTERDGLKILATVFSGNNECEKQDSSTGCRLRRASRKPSLFSRYLCVCQSPSLVLRRVAKDARRVQMAAAARSSRSTLDGDAL